MFRFEVAREPPRGLRDDVEAAGRRVDSTNIRHEFVASIPGDELLGQIDVMQNILKGAPRALRTHRRNLQ
jgi:hypothetical protein